MKHKGFDWDIFIGPKRVRFYRDETIDDLEYIIYITKDGYILREMNNNCSVEISRKNKLSLDKLNKLLPDDKQLSKDQIIYILTADKDEE